jgi:hypothetical protein
VKPSRPDAKGGGARYTAQLENPGGGEGERVEDGPVVARKRGNARGAMGPCCTCSCSEREARAE